MLIKNNSIFNAIYLFKYTLDTFYETRKLRWTYTPFTGQNLSGPENGLPPNVWDIDYVPEKNFKHETKTLKLQNTDHVK